MARRASATARGRLSRCSGGVPPWCPAGHRTHRVREEARLGPPGAVLSAGDEPHTTGRSDTRSRPVSPQVAQAVYAVDDPDRQSARGLSTRPPTCPHSRPTPYPATRDPRTVDPCASSTRSSRWSSSRRRPCRVHGRPGRSRPGRCRRPPAGSPGRWPRRTRCCVRSTRRRRRGPPAIAGWISAARRANRCSPPARAWWSSPVSSPTVRWCPSTTPAACGPPTSRSRPWWSPVSRWPGAPCSAISCPAIPAVPRRPACTGACAEARSTSTRSACSARTGCACSPGPASRRPGRGPPGQASARSISLARSRSTARVWSWQTRDSVTPRTRPISARVRFSK